MDDVYKKALDLHLENQGKLTVMSKVPLENRDDLSVAYTPGVAEVCRLIATDKSASFSHTYRGNTVAVVSDGSAILGLGNLGAEAALPVMEGKCVLFKEFGGVDAFPICLDTQDVEEIIKTVKYLAPSFGGINLEDISAPRCFEIEERLKQEMSIPVMHDDQHGTATVVLAALINSLKLKKTSKEDIRVLVNGAGAAGVAIVRLLLLYGVENIIVCDSRGIIFEGRENLNSIKEELALLTNRDKMSGDFKAAIRGIDVFIGVSVPDILDADLIKTMASRPVIMALANPIPEILPPIAKAAGAFIVAAGRSDYANQINNVLAFPGIFRGALDNKVKQITSEMLIQAANNLADLVDELDVDNILPSPFNHDVSRVVAEAIKE